QLRLRRLQCTQPLPPHSCRKEVPKSRHCHDVLSLAKDGWLEDYEFSTTGGPEELDPSILGMVFEQTINYLAGETGAQNDLGAYYTPDNITRFCADKSVRKSLLTRFKEVLQQEWNWREGELAHYSEVYELIEGLSPNQDVVESLLKEVDEFRVLDPACGSGHFLTSVLNEILSVRRSLYEKHDDSPSTHILKKRTVLQNLYGVDIVGPGVEITKLRLWLSIMSELTETDIDELEPGELALPNVAFNIREGNTLVGYTDTQRLRVEDDEKVNHQQAPLDEWVEKSVEELVEERQEMVDEFKQLYGEDAQTLQDEIDEKDEDYNRQLNEKLLEDMRDADVAFEHDQETIESPDIPCSAIHKVSIQFEDAIDTDRKAELSDEYQNETGMRINYGNGGYVSITLNHEYLVNTPDNRLQEIINTIEDNIANLEIQRYLTHTDLDELEFLHWPLEFYNVFKNGGFDVAIGNPPYGIDISDAESALDDYPDENHSSMVFASRAENLINDNGQIAYVVPKVLTYAYRWTDARNHLLNQSLDYLIDLREAFDGVKQEQIILMFSPEDGTDTVVVGRREEHQNGNSETFFEKNYQQSAFNEDCFFMWVDDDNEALLTKLGEYDTFNDVDFAEATKGVDAFKSYLTGDPNDIPAYRGDDIGQFRFVNTSYLDPKIKNKSNFHLSGHGDKKVIYRRILSHVTTPTDRIIINCAIDYKGVCTPDTSIHAEPNDHSLEFLCGLMNSSLFAWYTYNAIYNRAIRSMDLTPIYFGRLPAPPEENEELIETIEMCTEEIREMDSSEEDSLLSKYAELDDAIFDLYKLSDDEREVIKSETPPREETLLDW
ncbi:Eco57I restriction-modification methylase domain-containing protein, partial [Halovenus amylolytica]